MNTGNLLGVGSRVKHPAYGDGVIIRLHQAAYEVCFMTYGIKQVGKDYTAWEIVENTPMVIDRYREATIALGYSGDSILNSASDIAMMALGFLAARRLQTWASIGTVLLLELVPLLVIRDNLTLNVWMLLAPNDTIRAWQAG